MVDALIFDFDGLLLDTETPLFEAWSMTFEHFGADPIDLATWRTSVGLHDADPRRVDPLGTLLELLRGSVPVETIESHRRALRDSELDEADLRPGALAILDAARDAQIPVAIATSSPLEWVERHLEPRGVMDRFTFVSCAGESVPGKPHPATYLNACRELDVDPAQAVAFEDSPNGVSAAVAAGLHCVAVPNLITAGCDFDLADHVVSSMTELDVGRLVTSSGDGRAGGCPLC